MKKTILLFVLVTVIVVIDQWSKWYIDTHFYLGEVYKVIDGFFNLAYARNSGAAFSSFGQSDHWVRMLVLRFIPVVACCWLTVMVIKHKQHTNLLALAYAMILGGAVGNLIDRFRLDYVVDMFDFYHGTWHFATFNVADSAISVAAGLLIIDYLLNFKKETQK